MKQLLTPRRIVLILTGLLFAAYAAYNVFVLLRDYDSLPSEGLLISAAVAVLFAVLAVFAWTAEVENLLLQVIRRWAFVIAMLAVIALKLRIMGRVLSYLDLSKTHTILYGCSYIATLLALAVLFVYYAFIRTDLMFYNKAAVLLPLSAIVLLLGSLVLEAILFFGFRVMVEANVLRTLVIRPVFYLGFIGMAVFFLFPPREAAPPPETDVNMAIPELME